MINEAAYRLGSVRNVMRELFEYGNRRAAEIGRENVLDFSLGNPSIPAPPEVNEAIRQVLTQMDPLAVHGYTSSGGDFATREAIACDLNARFDACADGNDLFLTCGAAPGLTAVFRALAVPGAEILAIAPFFTEYRPFAENAGCVFRVVPADVPDFQIRLDAVEAMLTEHTAAIILNSPNNPAGTVYTAETLTALADLLRRKGKEYGHPIYIVSDEPYRELVYDGAVAPWVPGIYENTVVCYSYSKSLSLPGERIGYVYVPKQAENAPALYAAIAGAARACGHVCAPSLLQKVIQRCTHLRPDLKAYDRNRRTLYEGLTAMGYQVAKPEGAFYLFVRAPGGDAAAFSEKAKQKDLLLVPGGDFGCPDYLRVCYCVSYDTICRSLPIFRELIEA